MLLVFYADTPPNIFPCAGEFKFFRKQRAHSLRALGEDLVNVPVSLYHHAHDSPNIVSLWIVLLEKVTHRIDEDHLRGFPLERFQQLFRGRASGRNPAHTDGREHLENVQQMSVRNSVYSQGLFWCSLVLDSRWRRSSSISELTLIIDRLWKSASTLSPKVLSPFRICLFAAGGKSCYPSVFFQITQNAFVVSTNEGSSDVVQHI